MRLLFVILLLVSLLMIWGASKANNRTCVKYKTITDIQVVPLANFWGKEINYIVRYDNGSIWETTMGSLYRIGESTCIDFK